MFEDFDMVHSSSYHIVYFVSPERTPKNLFVPSYKGKYTRNKILRLAKDAT